MISKLVKAERDIQTKLFIEKVKCIVCKKRVQDFLIEQDQTCRYCLFKKSERKYLKRKWVGGQSTTSNFLIHVDDTRYTPYSPYYRGH